MFVLNTIATSASIPARRSVYYDIITNGVEGLGSCREWNVFSTDELQTTLIGYTPVVMKMASTDQVTSAIEPSVVICDNPAVVAFILNGLSTSATSQILNSTCKGHEWKAGNCGGSDGRFICVDCEDPCSSSSTTIPAYDLRCRSGLSTSANRMQVLILEFNDASVSPALIALSVSPNGNSKLIATFATDGTPGSIVCAAYQSSVHRIPLTAESLLVNGQLKSLNGSHGQYVISSLIPSTTYDVYCATLSTFGAPLGIERVKQLKRSTSTSCCRDLHVSLITPSVTAAQDSSNVLSVSTDVLPGSAMKVHINAIDSGGVIRYIFDPSVVLLSTASTSKVNFIAVKRSGAGLYRVNITLQGSTASKYSISFASGNYLSVLSSDDEPVPPVLKSARFSDDGTGVLVAFDSPTDRAGYRNYFECSNVFQITPAASTSCLWTSDSNVKLLGTNVAEIGTFINVKMNTIKAKCLYINGYVNPACKKWAYSNATIKIRVAEATTPIIPRVKILAPSQIGPCDDLTFDLSGSTGSGGRGFTSFSFSASSTNPAVSTLQQFLSNISSIKRPIQIRRDDLIPGYAYGISVTLCNFIGACATATHRFIVTTTAAIPIVSLSSKNLVIAYTYLPLRIVGEAYVSICNGPTRSSGLLYTWSLANEGIPMQVSSASSDPRVFLVEPYRLTVGQMYDLTLTVKDSVSLKTSSSSVTISVAQGAIVAHITGASRRTVRADGSVVIDASASYDQDRFQDISNLDFYFSCMQTSPVLTSQCLLNMVNVSTGKVQMIATNSSLIGSVHIISVSVIHRYDRRFSTASVTLTVLPSLAPLIRLRSISGVRVNPTDKFILTGSVTVSSTANVLWSIDDPLISLDQFSLSPVSLEFPTLPLLMTHRTFIVSLVLPASFLSGQSMYTFSLECNESSGYSTIESISVSTNSPPQPGTLVSIPENGTTLVTAFLLQASDWEDSDIPITYSFFYHSANGQYVNVRGRNEVTYVSTTLPPGQEIKDFGLTLRLQVFDSLEAMASIFGVVRVDFGSILAVSDIGNFMIEAAKNSSGSAGIFKLFLRFYKFVIAIQMH